MNATTKSVVGWIVVLTVIATIVMGGNYLIYTYVGIWNYVALSILSGISWAWIIHRQLKNHDRDMLRMAKVFVATHIKK